jgi:ribosome-associated heat shock protein Hsp15
MADDDDDHPDALRLDKWLWLTRFCKTRVIAQKLATKGRIRINGRPVDKPHALVRVNDVITLPLPAAVKVLKVLHLPARRGPAPEAQATYELLP